MGDEAADILSLSGKFIAEAAAADFEYFFLPGLGPKVPISIEGALHPGIRTNAEGTRIVIPPDMAADRIDTADKLFFHLLILGHEIAHLVHCHGHAGEQERDEQLPRERLRSYLPTGLLFLLSVSRKFSIFFLFLGAVLAMSDSRV